jgi:NifU-like protein
MAGEAKKADIVKPEKKPLTNLKRMQLVEETIANVIRPMLQKDGGDIELMDIDGKDVHVALRGHCVNCMVSDVTLKNTVEAKLREFVEEGISVHQAKS